MADTPKAGDTLVFKGYADPNIADEDKLLQPGQTFQVHSVNEDGSIAALPFNEDGSLNTEGGDTVYPDEYATQDEWNAAIAEAEAPAEEAPAAEAPATGKAKTGGKAKATGTKATSAKTTGKAATGAKAGTKATGTKTGGKATTAKKAAEPKAGAKGKGKIEATPPAVVEVTHTASVTSILAEQDALDAARSLVDQAGSAEFTLGGVLSHIKREGIHQRLGYDGKRGFDDYIEKELGVRYRKALYLITLYERATLLGVDESRLMSLGWAKAKEVIMLTSKKDVDEMIDYALETKEGGGLKHTRDDVIARVRSKVNAGTGNNAGTGSGASNNTTATKTKMTFSFFSDQTATVERAIASAKAQSGSDDENAAVEYICGEWLLMQENNPVSLEQAVSLLNARYGVNFVLDGASNTATNVAAEPVADTGTDETASAPAAADELVPA